MHPRWPPNPITSLTLASGFTRFRDNVTDSASYSAGCRRRRWRRRRDLSSVERDLTRTHGWPTVVGFFYALATVGRFAQKNMSKTIESAPQAAQKNVGLGPTMSGSEILVACLEREGIDTIFA